MLRRACALALLVLAAACGGGDPSSAPTPSAAPSVAPSAAARLLAVARAAGPLELYGLTGHTAVRVQTLTSPDPAARVVSLSLSGGPSPLVCAVWDLTGPAADRRDDHRLLCYPTGAAAGVEIAEAGTDVAVVAVRPDAAALAWVNTADNETLTVASFEKGKANDLRRYVADTSKPAGSGEKSFTGEGASSLAWATPSELVISVVVESDDGPAPRRFALPASGDGGGWLKAPRVVVPATEKGYFAYDSVVSASGPQALARMRSSWMDEGHQPDRAVRIDLASGAVREVLATAAEGRSITHVSGDGGTVVYRTAEPPDRAVEPDIDPKVYVRYTGDARGTQVTGLPADVAVVVTPS